MFSFHKPRVYRSTEGCCICRAKSSSSRFTDSKKYEDDSMKCFNLDNPRQGEICNACVLLVKRFKRLPAGSDRHWGHVVDARIGPGLKSMNKFKKIKDDSNNVNGGSNTKQQQLSSASNNSNSKSNNKKSTNGGKTSASNSSLADHRSTSIPEKFCKIFKKTKKKQILRDKNKTSTDMMINDNCTLLSTSWNKDMKIACPSQISDKFVYSNRSDDDNYNGNDGNLYQHYRHYNRQQQQQQSHTIAKVSRRRKLQNPKRNCNLTRELTKFFDENEWKRLKSCCGVVFENKNISALIIDIENYKPCPEHIRLPLTSSSSMSSSKMNFSHSNTANSKNFIIAPASLDTLKSKAIIESASSSSVKDEQQLKIATVVPVMKKHHLFLKRQMENVQMVTPSSTQTVTQTPKMTANLLLKTEGNGVITSTSSSSSVITAASVPVSNNSTTEMCTKAMVKPLSHDHYTNLKQIKPIGTVTDTKLHHQVGGNETAGGGKIMKHSVDKFNTVYVKQQQQQPLIQHQHALVQQPSHKVALTDLKNLVKINDKLIKTTVTTATATATAVGVSGSVGGGSGGIIVPANGNLKFTTIAAKKNFQKISTDVPLCNTTNNNNNHVGANKIIRNLTTATAVESSNTTKFNDNSSDSGFDENMLERKSSSPSGDESKRNLIHHHHHHNQPSSLAASSTASAVQTMFLASGVQICGQQQNIILTGNDVAARMLQHQQQQRRHLQQQPSQIYATNNTTNGTKTITQTITNSGGIHQKVSAIFNSNNNNNNNGNNMKITCGGGKTTTNIGVNTASANGGIITLATAGTSTASGIVSTSSSSSLSSTTSNVVGCLNQKIILVKAKYNTTAVAVNNTTIHPNSN